MKAIAFFIVLLVGLFFTKGCEVVDDTNSPVVIIHDHNYHRGKSVDRLTAVFKRNDDDLWFQFEYNQKDERATTDSSVWHPHDYALIYSTKISNLYAVSVSSTKENQSYEVSLLYDGKDVIFNDTITILSQDGPNLFPFFESIRFKKPAFYSVNYPYVVWDIRKIMELREEKKK